MKLGALQPWLPPFLSLFCNQFEFWFLPIVIVILDVEISNPSSFPMKNYTSVLLWWWHDDDDVNDDHDLPLLSYFALPFPIGIQGHSLRALCRGGWWSRWEWCWRLRCRRWPWAAHASCALDKEAIIAELSVHRGPTQLSLAANLHNLISCPRPPWISSSSYSFSCRSK